MMDVPTFSRGRDENLILYDVSGMHEARQAGQIVPIEGDMKLRMEDEWSHFSTQVDRCGVPTTVMRLDTTNTRYLDLNCVRVLEAICNNRDPKILELGLGAGVAAAEMFYIAQQYGRKPTIHTLSMTPINPKLMFRRDLLRVGRENYESSLSARLRTVSGLRSGIFRLLNEPFIQKQFIGFISSSDTIDALLEGDYDLIYDCHGPAAKNQAVLQMIVSSLGAKTVFLKNPLGVNDGAILRQAASTLRDIVSVLLGSSALVCGNESLEREAFRFMFSHWEKA